MSVKQIVMAAAGLGGAANPYIEDVFSTYLYTGNSSTQTITNGIDLSGEGGLVWIKKRSSAYQHDLYDTERGRAYTLHSNSTAAQEGPAASDKDLTSFNSNGFSLGPFGVTSLNTSPDPYASWSFRKTEKFFDVVTWTGNGVDGRSIPHNLGSVPGCIIVKRRNSTSSWSVYHRSVDATSPQNYRLLLELTNARSSTTVWKNTAPTDTAFTVNDNADVNASGGTYVAYLFAHDAGGFGDDGEQNVISCGSFTTDGSGNATVNLGYEPQYVMYKRSDGTGSWAMFDNMRGMTVNTTNGDAILFANLSDAESTVDWIQPTATGFNPYNIAWNATYIYIAIRRGPMKTPESGTSVFAPVSAIASGGTVRTTGFPVDLQILLEKDRYNYINTWAVDRLRGVSTTDTASGRYVFTNTTGAEATANAVTRNFGNTGYVDPSLFGSMSMLWWNFRRAPGFFDEVCYTGTGSARTVAHNLAAVPELMIVKRRGSSSFGEWLVWTSAFDPNYYVLLNGTQAINAGPAPAIWNGTAPTASVFSVGVYLSQTDNYVAYLFASCPGVSKVGSYTGNGSSQTINCGFTGGARFVLIKRTDSTGNWWVWDTARGMTAGTDYRIPLNTTDSDSNTNNVYTTTGGFEIVTSDSTINASGGTYIFLAIA